MVAEHPPAPSVREGVGRRAALEGRGGCCPSFFPDLREARG